MIDINTTQVNLQVRILTADLISFDVFEAAQKLPSPIPSDKFEFTTTLTFTTSFETKTFDTTVDLSIKHIESKELLGRIRSTFSILIENIEDTITIAPDGQQIFMGSIFVMCSSVSVSTTRGMLIIAAKDTNLRQAIFPVFDPANFAPKIEATSAVAVNKDSKPNEK